METPNTKMTHTTHTPTHKSICDLQAVWNVALQGITIDGEEILHEGIGNTFGEALCNMYNSACEDNCTYFYNLGQNVEILELIGGYTIGDEEYTLDYEMNIEMFEYMMVRYIKSKNSMEDLMAVSCKETRWSDNSLYWDALPLSAFTAGSKMAA